MCRMRRMNGPFLFSHNITFQKKSFITHFDSTFDAAQRIVERLKMIYMAQTSSRMEMRKRSFNLFVCAMYHAMFVSFIITYKHVHARVGN